MEVFEAHTLARELVDVWRLNLTAVVADIRIPEIIGHDKNDVRLVRCSCREAH
jgi:hypothetical protein